MERLFSSCTRYRDLLESQRRPASRLEPWRELNLDVSTEELLSSERAFTYADLYAMSEKQRNGRVADTACSCRACEWESVYSLGQLGESCSFCFSADGKDIFAMARSPEHSSEICDVLLQLLAVGVIHSVTLRKWTPAANFPTPTTANATATGTYTENVAAVPASVVCIDDHYSCCCYKRCHSNMRG
jgi:hypothetical protein